MKINKWLLTLAAAGMLTIFTVGYSEAQTTETSLQKTTSEIAAAVKQDFSELNGKIGTCISSRADIEKVKAMVNKACNCKIENLILSENTNGCLAMLKSGRADFIFTSDITANYILQRNPEFKSLVTKSVMSVSMVLRSSDTRIRDLFNSALAKIKASGKNDELYKTWITQLPIGEEPSMTKIEKTADTETIYVGVAGDMPPLDYIAADGKPAGFNIAMLSEISKITGKNIEVISIDSQARFAALESKKIDVFFWMWKSADQTKQKKFEATPEQQEFVKKFISTDHYCELKPAFVLKK